MRTSIIFYLFFLQTCIPLEDFKQDQSIDDELDDLVNNKDMASSLDMSAILLHECNNSGKYYHLELQNAKYFLVIKMH